MSGALLVFNVGSSSIKLACYSRGPLTLSWRCRIESIGGDARLTLEGEAPLELRAETFPADADRATAIAWIVKQLRSAQVLDIAAAAHRVVHGGRDFLAPMRLDADAIEALDRLAPLAPNHQPHNLAAIRALAAAWPTLPQFASFDTSFHRTQLPIAERYGLPRAQTEAGVVRYGFHGLSYDFIAARLAELIGQRADGRVIAAHLGHGASLCAMRGRRSVATTMGFTALDGLAMGTRCGALDPGVLLYWLREKIFDVDQIDDLLNNRSGLLGVSNISDDVRTLEDSDDARAEEALEFFAYRAGREIGSLAAAIGGLDTLVLTAGIGENSAAMRKRIAHYAGWLGVVLDEEANARGAARISSERSAVDVWVIPTDEEHTIARDADRLLAGTV